jgi:ribonuclease P/MRP protein subunit POP7
VHESRQLRTPSTSCQLESMAKTKSTSAVLAELKFEKKNKPQPRLPPNTTIQRRPLNHGPIASPYAGASVQKVVYVSRSTPLMAAVKRVKKLLSHVEKRAMQEVDITKGKNGLKKLAAASEALGKDGEEVVVRASGRAIEQALKVGEWFEGKERELACKVDVRTGSVQVVDDLVEAEGDEADDVKGEEVAGSAEAGAESMQQGVAVSSNDTTEATAEETPSKADNPEQKVETKGKKRRKRGKRKRTMYDKDDMPEARIRWINTVEVAISLKG